MHEARHDGSMTTRLALGQSLVSRQTAAEITKLVNVYMTKGEGAPALLEKLGSLFKN